MEGYDGGFRTTASLTPVVGMKRKKKKAKRRRSTPSPSPPPLTQEETDITTHKKKKEKLHRSPPPSSPPPVKLEEETDITIHKKKKKKEKRHRSPSPEIQEEETVITTHKAKKKVKVMTKYIQNVPSRNAPFVTYFPSGYDPLKNGDKNLPDVSLFRNKKRSNRVELVVRPQGSELDFVGKSYTGEAVCPKICSYALGVFDKETNELKILPIETDKILRLEPRVIEQQYIEQKLTEDNLDASASLKRYRELTNLYGSKKNRTLNKKYQSMEDQRNNPDAQACAQDQMKDIQINRTANENTAQVILNVPPHDLSASSPEKAYLINKIIPKDEWKYLNNILEMVNSGKDLDTTSEFYRSGAFPCFVVNRIGKIRDSKDNSRKEELGRLFAYITHLITFMNMSFQKNFSEIIQSSVSAESILNIPRLVFQKFLKLFVDSESQKVSHEKKDLLISYILVVTLFVDNFSSSSTDIAKDLKKNYSALVPHYLQLGCKINSKGHTTLPIPLKFPTMLVVKRFQKKK